MRIAAPGRTGWGRWGYRDGWTIVIRNSTGLDMRAPLAAMAADRISRSAILVAGVLCGALVFFVAIPLALSNPFPTLKEAEWAVHRSSLHIKVPISEMVEAQALFERVSANRIVFWGCVGQVQPLLLHRGSEILEMGI